jgi:GT2 family glycosyltransferase
MTPQVSVIVVNWNGLTHLPDCLDSLEAQTFRDFEVVLVDNGSEDGSVAFVREQVPSDLASRTGAAVAMFAEVRARQGGLRMRNLCTWAGPASLATALRSARLAWLSLAKEAAAHPVREVRLD